MIAETAYNVIQALPTNELSRLYGMLGVVEIGKEPTKQRRGRRKSKEINRAEVRERLIKSLLRIQKRNCKKLEEIGEQEVFLR